MQKNRGRIKDDEVASIRQDAEWEALGFLNETSLSFLQIFVGMND
jgi:hypothetical protein